MCHDMTTCLFCNVRRQGEEGPNGLGLLSWVGLDLALLPIFHIHKHKPTLGQTLISRFRPSPKIRGSTDNFFILFFSAVNGYPTVENAQVALWCFVVISNTFSSGRTLVGLVPLFPLCLDSVSLKQR